MQGQGRGYWFHGVLQFRIPYSVVNHAKNTKEFYRILELIKKIAWNTNEFLGLQNSSSKFKNLALNKSQVQKSVEDTFGLLLNFEVIFWYKMRMI